MFNLFKSTNLLFGGGIPSKIKLIIMLKTILYSGVYRSHNRFLIFYIELAPNSKKENDQIVRALPQPLRSCYPGFLLRDNWCLPVLTNSGSFLYTHAVQWWYNVNRKCNLQFSRPYTKKFNPNDAVVNVIQVLQNKEVVFNKIFTLSHIWNSNSLHKI